MFSSQAAKRRQRRFVLSIALCVVLLLLVQTGLWLAILLVPSSPWFSFAFGGFFVSCFLIAGLGVFCVTSGPNLREMDVGGQGWQFRVIFSLASCVIALLEFFLLWFFTYIYDQTHSFPPHEFLSDPYLGDIVGFLAANILACSPIMQLGMILSQALRNRMQTKRK